MAQPDLARVRSIHPKKFDVTGLIKDEGNLEERAEALKAIAKKASSELKVVLKALKEEYDGMTIKKLGEVAEGLGLEAPEKAKKVKLIELIMNR